MAQEPTIQTVHRWVARPYHDEMNTIRHKPWAAAIPHRFRLQVSGKDEGDWYNTITDDDSWRRRLGGESRLGWRVDVEWDFSQLVQSPVEVARARMTAFSADRRRKEIELATNIYFQRRQHQWSYWTNGQLDTNKRSELWWKIQALTSRLVAMTSGRFLAAMQMDRCPVAANKPVP